MTSDLSTRTTRIRGPRSDKSPQRTAIEEALQKAGGPITRMQLALKCNLSLERVNAVISTLRHHDLITRAPNSDAGETRYQWATHGTTPPPAAKPASAPTPATYRAPIYGGRDYKGSELKPFAGRPGAMDAFDVPSIHNGDRVERRPPIIMGCTPRLRDGPT